MRSYPALLLVGWAALGGLAACGKPAPPDGRVVLRYWDKWTGFEAEAMRAVVQDFNASQNRILVQYTSVSQIDRKLMLATAGGVPPDVAGIWSSTIPVYAENNALTPLDRMAASGGVRREDYIDVFWQGCSHMGRLFALPSTPTSTALIYNKRLFREAGLDPERPPRSIAELEAFNEVLVRRRADDRLERVGHLPEEPGWWNALWGLWFGARIAPDGRTLGLLDPDNQAAYRWVQSYPERFGGENLAAFRDGFGNFASPQNPFFTGRVAMVLHGVWIHNFISNYAPPGFEWGVAPFPTVDPERLRDVTVVEADVLVIPAGAAHPREAFEFIRYVNLPGPMEKLCLGQRKFPPLRSVSPDFFRSHPNPHIREFVRLAFSPNAQLAPRITTWNSLAADMRNAIGRIWLGRADAGEALTAVQERQQALLNRRLERWDRMGPGILRGWETP